MMTESALTTFERRLLATILFFIVLLVAVDLLTDSREGVELPHLLVELSVAVGAAIGIFLLLRDSFRKSHVLVRTQGELLHQQKEVVRWKTESHKILQGLSVAIDAQMERWQLTSSEKEVALLLLKGLSIKMIAEMRNTSEKTVRAQSVAIYAKSGLAGRAELSAFFLEDLLLPSQPI